VVVMKSTLFQIVHESNLMADNQGADAIKRWQHSHQAVLLDLAIGFCVKRSSGPVVAFVPCEGE
jgi:hypothetical protein